MADMRPKNIAKPDQTEPALSVTTGTGLSKSMKTILKSSDDTEYSEARFPVYQKWLEDTRTG